MLVFRRRHHYRTVTQMFSGVRSTCRDSSKMLVPNGTGIRPENITETVLPVSSTDPGDVT